METPTLLVSEEAGIKTVTINRPQRRNALDAQTLALLRDAIAQAAHDSSRVVILTGAGDAFCSGADLRARTPDALRAFDITAALRSYANTIVLLMRRSAKPFIARVHGPAAGMGCNLALACDLRIASEEAGFSQAFIRIGLMPDGGGTFFLPRLVGYAKAFELMATGALVSARDALSHGPGQPGGHGLRPRRDCARAGGKPGGGAGRRAGQDQGGTELERAGGPGGDAGV